MADGGMKWEQWLEFLLNDLNPPALSPDPFQDSDPNRLARIESEFAALLPDKTEEGNYGPSVVKTDKTSQIDQDQMSIPEAAQAIRSGTIGDEAEEASKTYQNQFKPETAKAIHYAAKPRTKVKSRTGLLNQQNGNTLPNYWSEGESDASDLKGKATLDSMTPIEKIRREERKNLENDVGSLSQQKRELTERVQCLENVIQLLMCNNQPKFPMKRKAVFELNFHDDESKAEAMKIVLGLSGMDEILLKLKKRRLKLKGSFDAGALLYDLNNICDTRLVSEKFVSSTPRPSTGANLRVPAKKR